MTVQPIEHIVKTPDVVGGSARIAGRRIAVYQIAYLHEWENVPVADLAAQFELTPAQVHAALAYYHDNQAEVLREIQAVELAGPPPDHRPRIDGILERWQAQTGHNPNEELTVAQVAEEYGISPQTVREACAKGWIAGRKSGTIWLIRRLSAHNRWG
ncbi:MAG: DUF433 domain-containing protein [Anaerolineae bacterium]|nr:DUF433 domain-containing protein [Anaerolineae bacterium]